MLRETNVFHSRPYYIVVPNDWIFITMRMNATTLELFNNDKSVGWSTRDSAAAAYINDTYGLAIGSTHPGAVLDDRGITGDIDVCIAGGKGSGIEN